MLFLIEKKTEIDYINTVAKLQQESAFKTFL